MPEHTPSKKKLFTPEKTKEFVEREEKRGGAPSPLSITPQKIARSTSVPSVPSQAIIEQRNRLFGRSIHNTMKKPPNLSFLETLDFETNKAIAKNNSKNGSSFFSNFFIRLGNHLRKPAMFLPEFCEGDHLLTMSNEELKTSSKSKKMHGTVSKNEPFSFPTRPKPLKPRRMKENATKKRCCGLFNVSKVK